MKDYLRAMLQRVKEGYHCGIPSFCTANPIVIEACIEQAKRNDDYVLIEATANQVNQFGGYTGMCPADFRDMVYSIADKLGFPREKLILGGDHLGPLIWSELDEEDAMLRAEVLVREFVLAGYHKIHLDTSMMLGNDPVDTELPDSVIAARGVRLYAACEQAYQQLLDVDCNAQRPVYIIGSEVPVPGGLQHNESRIKITTPQALKNTLEAYSEAFEKKGFADAFSNVIGVVVQPGVEFGDAGIVNYDRAKAHELTRCAASYSTIVLEGHSTDYQMPEALREMVHDGIAILKVGPALTYALREGLFALSMMERELIASEERANFIDLLENEMLKDTSNWEKHYHGSEISKYLCRRYSYSDRCRYYLSTEPVRQSIHKLIYNMSSVNIPLNMLHQYMPLQYAKVVRGELTPTALELVKDYVVNVTDDYNYAVKARYDIAAVHY